MMSLLLYPVAGLAGAAIATLALWFTKPAVIVKYGMRFVLRNSGCTTKFVTIDKKQHCYAERGIPSELKPTMVLIHGFSASKDMWVQLIKRMPADMHIIALDLMGHGQTYTPDSEEDITFDGYVLSMKKVLSAIGVDRRPFHLVGTSFGGVLSALYSATYPSDVSKVSLICPAVRTPIESDFMHEIRSGYCRLLPEDVDGLQTMIDSCVYKKVKFNRQLLKGILELRKPHNAFFNRLFQTIMAIESDPVKSEDVEKRAHDIRMPLQVIWGQQDELIHPSGAEMIKSEVASCVRMDMIDRCGHSVNMDRPGQAVKVLLQFRGELTEQPTKNGKHH